MMPSEGLCTVMQHKSYAVMCLAYPTSLCLEQTIFPIFPTHTVLNLTVASWWPQMACFCPPMRTPSRIILGLSSYLSMPSKRTES